MSFFHLIAICFRAEVLYCRLYWVLSHNESHHLFSHHRTTRNQDICDDCPLAKVSMLPSHTNNRTAKHQHVNIVTETLSACSCVHQPTSGTRKSQDSAPLSHLQPECSICHVAMLEHMLSNTAEAKLSANVGDASAQPEMLLTSNSAEKTCSAQGSSASPQSSTSAHVPLEASLKVSQV